ncbi:MAG: hypothetical protein ACOCR6_03815 [archaeon]
MVSVADGIGLAVIVLTNTAIAALLTRFFRVRLQTDWAGPLYAFGLGSLSLLVTTLVLAGFLTMGPNLGSPGVVVGVTILTPLALGMAIDYFWMPAPEDVTLPERDEQHPPETR